MNHKHTLSIARFMKKRAMVVLASGLVGSMMLAACSSSSSASSASSASSSVAGYFKGKTITLIAPDAPGGDYDLYARGYAPALSKILHATVNVENIPGAGTIVGTNTLAAATPNGLTLGMANVPGVIGDSLEHLPGVKFNLTKLTFLLQPGTIPDVLLVQKKSAVKSFGELLKQTTPVSVGVNPSGIGFVVTSTVFGAFKIPHKYITGISDIVLEKQGFLAGDYTYTLDALTGLQSLITGGSARPLLVTSTPTESSLKSLVPGVPTLAQEISKYSSRLSSAGKAALIEADNLSNTGFDFVAPPGMSKAKTTFLRAAFVKAAQSSTTRAILSKIHEPQNYTTGSALKKIVLQSVANGEAIAPYAKKP